MAGNLEEIALPSTLGFLMARVITLKPYLAVIPTAADHSSALLDSVKVALPDQGLIALKEVASVTVKSGTLYVEVWDTDVSDSQQLMLRLHRIRGFSQLPAAGR